MASVEIDVLADEIDPSRSFEYADMLIRTPVDFDEI
jgi:hypothetical protein